MIKQYIDVIVHIPLEEEYREFIELFPTRENISTETHLAYIVDAPSQLRVAVVLQNGMGRSAAMAACASMLEHYTCKLYVCLGIAGGLSKDLSLGDVCYTGNLIDVYDNSKVTDAGEGGINIAFNPEHYRTLDRLSVALGFVRTMTELKPLLEFWTEDQANFAQRLLNAPVAGRDGEDETIGAPKCLNGFIVCGAVSESDNYRERLKGITRSILAVETESGAVFDLCGRRGIEALTIRGISDYANRSKCELEGATKNQVRKIAAHNAASFLHMQLQNSVFLAALGRLAANENTSPLLSLIEVPAAAKLPELIDALSVNFDAKLRELSPQYRTKPSGYRLPTPRLKPANELAGGDPRERPSALEVQAVLAQNRKMIIHVPRTYPDPALSYVLANGLLLSDVGGKKVVPVVINGSMIGPPKSGLMQASDIPLIHDIAQHGGEYIWIIDSPILTSKTRLAFLVSQIKDLENGRVIIVTRDDKSFIQELDLKRSLSAEGFDVCDVSFAEMANFLEYSFEMPVAEAEVVALKLRQLFHDFSLPAHPSFLAGIPSETLSALLLANRRSELIQLAVDGFLTFIVAGDADPVRLSRTKRASFLRKLVVDMAVEKRSFSQSEIVQYAEDMSEEYDYGIKSISFIKSFEDNGLIHFEDGKAVITLPFMQSYLLALELVEDSNLAKRYFDLTSDDIDLLTFDLYSEINPSDAVYDTVVNALRESIEAIDSTYEDHILLKGEVYPRILRNPARIVALSNRVGEAKQALDTDASDRAEKIRILEIADRVNEDIASSIDGDPSDDKETDVRQPALWPLILTWVVATILLGSGAESIKGGERQELSALIIRGADVILHAWTELFASFDYEEIRTKIVGDAKFKEALGINDDEEFERVVSALVEFVEFTALSEPLNRVLNQLLDQAQQAIIGNSVARVSAGKHLEKLIQGIWLTNINKDVGKDILDEAVANMPTALFLRSMLTSLIIARVRWKLSSKPLRYYLLDTAQAIVKPINPHLDKGELMRFVDRNDGSGELIAISDD